MATDATTRFERAYEAGLARWPTGTRSVEVATRDGHVHLLDTGPGAGDPVLLFPGGGATALAWTAVANILAPDRRILAVDPPGQAGRSSRDPTTPPTLEWIGAVVDGVAGGRAEMIGHSYGAWMALRFALDRPGSVTRLGLVDPTDCFAGLRVGYRLRAAPLFARPTGDRFRRFVAWETGGRDIDADWLAMAVAGADLGRPAIVTPRRPSPDELARLTIPTSIVTASAGRAHDPARVAVGAGALGGTVKTVALDGATHHTLPTEDADRLVEALA